MTERRDPFHEWLERPAPTLPACHAWPVPSLNELPAAFRHKHRERSASSLKYLEAAGTWAFDMWQDGDCAVCGTHAGDYLVQDHDHANGLVRGYLCRRCNAAEGVSTLPIYDAYRRRPPAVILGVELEYADLWGRDPAPLRGIYLSVMERPQGDYQTIEREMKRGI